MSLFFSCKNENANTQDKSQKGEPIDILTVEIPSDFIPFYEQFHTDSLFQINHIVFPLAQKEDGTKWQRNQWIMHTPFDSQGGAFSRSFENFNGIIFEYIVEKSGAFKIEKRYSKTTDSYQLIYYTSKVTLEGWTPEKE